MKVKFKEESQWLDVVGLGRVDRHNLTDDLYDQVMKISPAFGKYFTTTAEAKKESVSNGKG